MFNLQVISSDCFLFTRRPAVEIPCTDVCSGWMSVWLTGWHSMVNHCAVVCGPHGKSLYGQSLCVLCSGGGQPGPASSSLTTVFGISHSDMLSNLSVSIPIRISDWWISLGKPFMPSFAFSPCLVILYIKRLRLQLPGKDTVFYFYCNSHMWQREGLTL